MVRRKRLLMSLAGLVLVFGLIWTLSGILTAATADKPVTFKEWAAKTGMDWGSKYFPTKPVRGGIACYASPLYIGLTNPHHWPVNDWVSMGAFYDKLLVTDGSYRPAVPMLAESWKYLDDLTVVMKLRQGVQFHDGSFLNAEGLKYYMDWIMNPKNGAWDRAWMEPVSSVEVVDTYTVKFRFKQPWAGFLGVMSNVPGYVVSAKALKADSALKDSKQLAGQVEREKRNVEQAEKEISAGGEAAEKAKPRVEAARKKLASLEEEHKKAAALSEGAKELDSYPVGAGPYIFEEGSSGNYLKAKRNPNWWFAKFSGMPMPYFDGFKTYIIPDPTIRLANLRAGKIDSLVLDPSQIAMFKNERNLQVFKNTVNWITAMRFNTTAGPCKDLRVRKAISHAIDRKALIAGVDFGLGRPASCMYPEDHWCHNPNLKVVNYDPELSKKLLAQAGYKNGLIIKGYMSNLTQSMSSAEAIKAMLAKVGITWNIEFLDPAASSERMRKLDYDFAAGGWAWIYDPDLMPTGLYHPDGGFNFGRSNNKKAIELIEAGRKELDFEKRKKIYWELEKVLYDNYEDAWLWWPRYVSAVRKNVMGLNQAMGNQFKEAFSVTHSTWFKDGKENRY